MSPTDVSLLIFLAGLGQTPQSWQDQVTALPAGVKAAAPWITGLRPGSDQEFDLDRAADDTLAHLNEYGVDSAALCGVSLGAMVAMNAAVRSPEAVSHLVVVAGQVGPPRWLLRAQRAAIGLMPASRFAGLATKERLQQVMAALERADLHDRLGRISARTLVICGSEDRANLPASRQLAGLISGARLAIVQGAGHRANEEQPAEFNRLLYGFIGE